MDKLFFNQPKSLKILFLAEFVERFSYWGLQSLLILYLTKNLNVSNDKAYVIYGTFTACTFAWSILGGLLADFILGFRKAIIIGASLATIGNLCLMFHNLEMIYIGLSFLISGTALFVPNNANLLGTFYEKNDNQRDKGFTIFYMGTNLGGLFGPIFYGMIAVKYGWHDCFLISAIALATWLILFLLNHKLFIKNGFPPPKAYKNIYLRLCLHHLLYPTLGIAVVVIWILIQHINFAGGLLAIVGVVTLLSLISVAISKPIIERNAIFILLVMMLFCLLFFANELQVNSSLLLFIEQHVNRQLFLWQIPTSAFASFEPLFVIILAPVITYIWTLLKEKEPSPILKLTLGLLLEAVGFYIFALAAYSVGNADSKISIFWLLAGNLFLGAGEICLMPTIISAITELAPNELKGAMMGTLYLALAFSSFITGLIATLTTSKSNLKAITEAGGYAYVYSHIAQFALAATVVGFIFYTFTRRVRYSEP